MCFIIHPDYPNELIAEEDIVCYKVLRKNNCIWETPHRYKMVMVASETKTIELVEVKFGIYESCDGDRYIREGIHSYSEKLEADKESFYSAWKVFKAIIPKGTPYYYNSKYKEYVSLKLIILSKPINNEEKDQRTVA